MGVTINTAVDPVEAILVTIGPITSKVVARVGMSVGSQISLVIPVDGSSNRRPNLGKYENSYRMVISKFRCFLLPLASP